MAAKRKRGKHHEMLSKYVGPFEGLNTSTFQILLLEHNIKLGNIKAANEIIESAGLNVNTRLPIILTGFQAAIESGRLKAAHDVLRAYKIHPTIYKPYRDRAIIALIENGSDIQAAEAAELFYVTADEFRAMAYIGVAIRNKKKIQKD